MKKIKVKCTLVHALRLCTGRTAHRKSRGITLLFHDHGTRKGWGVSVTPRPLFPPEKTWYPFYRRLGGPQGRSGLVRKISPPTGIRSSDRPSRSQSLYRLRNSAHQFLLGCSHNLLPVHFPVEMDQLNVGISARVPPSKKKKINKNNNLT